ncbi:phage tail tape measure protein lambda family protein [Vibrio cholerae]|nr:phage tail tape measure protein lambda family protein [Vibrio cholerae]
MSAAASTDFSIRFNAETAKFQKDVDYAKKMLRGYAKEAIAANDATADFDTKLDQASKNLRSFGSGMLSVAGYVSAGMGTVVAASAMMVRQTADQAREIERMANVAQVSVEEIQAMSYAAKQYNINGDKMADILKDTNDKLGDFLETGGGEFADFFENIAPKVGITAQELSKLSSPEVLVAVKNAMDAANVPMKEQIFYLESIADEASALMPLLDDNGKQLYELTKRYQDLNVSMSEYDIEKFKQMDQKLEDVSLKLQKSFANAVVGAGDQIDWFTDKLTVAIDYWGSLFDSFADTPRTENGLVKRLSELRSELKDLKPKRDEILESLKEYDNVDESSLPSINPFGRSRNSLFNLNVDYAMVDREIKAKEAEMARLQEQYNRQRFGMNYGDQPKPKAMPQGDGLNAKQETELANLQRNGANRLDALDMQYASERDKLKLAHEQRLLDIEQLELSEVELKKRGYDSIEAMRLEYKERENEFYLTQQQEFEERQEEAIQREIDAFARKEDEKTRKAEAAAKQRAATEQRLESQVFALKTQVAGQTLGLIADTAKQGSAIQKVAFAAQKLMAAYTVYQQGEIAAMAALAPPPIGLGPVAGATYAGTIRAMSAISAGMIMGQAIAGMAHSGISEIPREGTWLLDKGERVYTNDSARQIDSMYAAIMSMQYRMPSFSEVGYQQAAAQSSQPWTLIINEAQPGTVAEIDYEKRTIQTMLKDAQKSGDYFSYISQKMGSQIGGYK